MAVQYILKCYKTGLFYTVLCHYVEACTEKNQKPPELCNADHKSCITISDY